MRRLARKVIRPPSRARRRITAFVFLCEEPRNNSSFCKAHKRAYETMYRAAMAEGARKKPSEDAEWDEALECWKLCEYWIFIQMFGDYKERKL